MRYKIALIFILLFLISGFLPLNSQQCFTMTQDIFIAEDEEQDNVISFGGNVVIEGKVRESVVTFGGEVTISGEVGELVLGFGSNITLKSSAVIDGDVVSLGGELEKEPGCIIQGDTVYFKGFEDLTEFLGPGLKGALIPMIIFFKLVSVFITFLLALLITALFPRQITHASTQIRNSFWPIVGTGLLSIIVYVGLVIFATLLSFVLIGIPILIALIIIGIVIKLFGRVVLFYFFGDSLIRAFGKGKASVFGGMILGFILVSFISFIPILGGLFTFCLSIIGWGVVVRTKFGTTENWFKKKSEA
ncbi:MAG: polymer-forming cytoskeletal protein [Candidatus Aminicenantes bacterium]